MPLSHLERNGVISKLSLRDVSGGKKKDKKAWSKGKTEIRRKTKKNGFDKKLNGVNVRSRKVLFLQKEKKGFIVVTWNKSALGSPMVAP